MYALQCVLKCRSIMFGEDVMTNLDAIRGCHTDDESIEGSVVDRAHRDAIGNNRFAASASSLIWAASRALDDGVDIARTVARTRRARGRGIRADEAAVGLRPARIPDV